MDVTLLERDVLPRVDSAEEAFAVERAGAPQVHQTHGFLARLQVVLRDRFPDVFAKLLQAGGITMPTTANLGEPEPGDEDLAVMIVRRSTLEWVLRQAVLDEPGVVVRTGVGVAGLIAGAGPEDVPVVTGVRLDDGTSVDADLVVAANGRRSAIPAWLEQIGAPIVETVVDSGLMYLTRWYRQPPALDLTKDPKLGGDLRFVKFLGVPGDGDTLSVTLAIRTSDVELRRSLSSPEGFDLACQLLPGPDRFFEHGVLEPIGPVRPMGGLVNRLRRFTDENGKPLVAGFHAVGDAHTCTNPLYGRGCALALVQAVLLADAVTAHPDDPIARGTTYEAGSAAQVEPWFEVSVQFDRLGADPANEHFADSPEAKAMGAVFAAAATDPIIGRAMVRFWNLHDDTG